MDTTIKVTRRESQIWALMADGMTKKEVASHLDRSYHTVNQIVRQLYEKLSIRKETELVREWFIFHSLVTRDEFTRAIRQKGAPVVFGFLLLTSVQIAFDSPAVRVMRTGRTASSRSGNRTPSGRRKTTYYV